MCAPPHHRTRVQNERRLVFQIVITAVVVGVAGLCVFLVWRRCRAKPVKRNTLL
jgi:multisubunit Na+/H+ antiporter MnhC subunit